MRIIAEFEDPKKARNIKIIAFCKTEMSYEEIAVKFGLTRAMISHIAISNGVIRKPEYISPTKWNRG